jgi:hypothetical protein
MAFELVSLHPYEGIGDDVEYLDSGLADGTYNYRVFTVNAAGDSLPTAVMQIIVPEPQAWEVIYFNDYEDGNVTEWKTKQTNGTPYVAVSNVDIDGGKKIRLPKFASQISYNEVHFSDAVTIVIGDWYRVTWAAGSTQSANNQMYVALKRDDTVDNSLTYYGANTDISTNATPIVTQTPAFQAITDFLKWKGNLAQFANSSTPDYDDFMLEHYVGLPIGLDPTIVTIHDDFTGDGTFDARVPDTVDNGNVWGLGSSTWSTLSGETVRNGGSTGPVITCNGINKDIEAHVTRGGGNVGFSYDGSGSNQSMYMNGTQARITIGGSIVSSLAITELTGTLKCQIRENFLGGSYKPDSTAEEALPNYTSPVLEHTAVDVLLYSTNNNGILQDIKVTEYA